MDKSYWQSVLRKATKIEYFVLTTFGFSNLRPDMLNYYSINRSDVTLVPNMERRIERLKCTHVASTSYNPNNSLQSINLVCSRVTLKWHRHSQCWPYRAMTFCRFTLGRTSGVFRLSWQTLLSSLCNRANIKYATGKNRGNKFIKKLSKTNPN